MITANEALVLTYNAEAEKINIGKAKAHDFENTLSECIRNAAKVGAISTEIYPLRTQAFGSDTEKRAYVRELLIILDRAGYTAVYHYETQSMQISWA